MIQSRKELLKAAVLLGVALAFLLYAVLFTIDDAWCLDTWSVSKITPSVSVWNGSNLDVPALVKGTKNAVPVAEWGAARVTPAIGSSLISRVAVGAGVMGAVYLGATLVDYLYDKGMEYIQGELNKTVPGAFAFSSDVMTALSIPANSKIYGNKDFTPIANFDCGSFTPMYSGWGLFGSYQGHYVWKNTAICQGCCNAPSMDIYAPAIANDPVLGSMGANTKAVASEADVQAVTQTALENGEAKAKAALEDVLTKTSAALDNPVDPLAVTKPAVVTNLKNDLATAVTATQKASMDATAATSDAAKTYATTAGAMSKADMISAVKTAMDDGGGVSGANLTLVPDATAPTKTTVTSVLDTWWAGLMSLPVVSLLSNMQVQAAGSPVISLNIPGFIGGSAQTVTYDFSQHGEVWNFMGNVLLAMTGIFWTMYIFEG